MGSLEEDQLFQMVHDFIESESASEDPVSSCQSLPFSDNFAKHYILQEIVESRTAAEDGVLGCVLKNMRNKMEADKTSSLKKWLVMKLRKNGYDGASLCQTSWPTTLGCPCGDYEFVEIVIKAANRRVLRLILDIDFKSQFELARPTSSYNELLDKLPSIFVGDVQKLTRIISILCSEAKVSLKERGLHIPPWRTTSYMQSKWLSNPQRIPLNPTTEVGLGYKEALPKFNSLTAIAPKVKKPKEGDFVSSTSALSSQFANFSTKCC